MIKAFIEPIFRPSLIIRVGEDCDRYRKRYDYAVQITIPWRSALLWLCGFTVDVIGKGLVNPEKRPISPAHYFTVIRLCRRHRLNLEWERYPEGTDGSL